MFVVGIAQLARSLEEESAGLAEVLGLTVYETRLALAGGFPAVVLTTPEKSRALEVLAELRKRGDEAIAFDTAAVVGSPLAFSPKRFGFEADALVGQAEEEQRLPFSDIAVLLRAWQETRTESTAVHRERRFSLGRALLTGGLSVSKTTERTVTSRTEERQEVLYVFRQSGQKLWLIRESGTRYDGLGDKRASTERANFVLLVAMLRERAPAAIYDDRLVGRKIPERISRLTVQGSRADGRTEIHSDAGMDLLAHMLALWLLKRGRAQTR